ncbi:MAG: hypothetical protein ABI551_02425, partial [Polyangiaceae bacterium]
VIPVALGVPANQTGSSVALVAPRSSRARTGGIVVALAAAGAAAIFFVSRSSTTPSAPALVPPTATSAAFATPDLSAASAAPAASVHVEIHAQPPNAEVSVDGTVSGSNWVRDLAPSPTPRHVKITAPGFAPLERDLVLDQSTYVDLKLDKLSTPKGRARKSAPAGAGISKPSGPEIDESDPYRK